MKLGLLPFIFLSASAHYAVFNHGMPWPLDINESGEQGRSGFAIEIIHTKIANKPVSLPAGKNTDKPIDKFLTRQVEKEVVTMNETATHPVNKQLKQAVKPAAKDIELTEIRDTTVKQAATDKNIVLDSSLKKLLKEELDKYFYYPKAAVRRNWEGKLVVSFVIHQDGHIDNIRISESSGYDILDNAAIKSVQQIKLPDNNHLLSLADNTETSLPVKYILN